MREGQIPSMKRLFCTLTFCILFWSAAHADGSLDGRVFTGVLGPEENPVQPDSLYFSDGHFWSDICADCGFEPGAYITKATEKGLEFSGILESESRGKFTYDGLIESDGAIKVSIQWERRRWYWTSQRKLAFLGKDEGEALVVTLKDVRLQLENLDTDSNPLCARF
jgi:hypothetical protein